MITYPQVIIPSMLGILVGECVYNLRAALDYLVFELALLDSGSVQKGTQFPIEKDKSSFYGGTKGSRRDRYIGKLSPGHQTAIERLQPYNGCNWTRGLNVLSNPDKHVSLTMVNPTKLVDYGRVNYPTFEPLSTQSVDMDIRVAFNVTFDDGMPVVETLQILHSEVTSVLDGFKPEF